MKERPLVHWVYYRPIGHAIEAYRLARASRNANPDFGIAVAVNAQSGPELGACVGAIDHIYAMRRLHYISRRIQACPSLSSALACALFFD